MRWQIARSEVYAKQSLIATSSRRIKGQNFENSSASCAGNGARLSEHVSRAETMFVTSLKRNYHISIEMAAARSRAHPLLGCPGALTLIELVHGISFTWH